MRKEKHHWAEIMGGIAFAINVLAFIASIHFWQWHWFARSGALMVVTGIILTGTQFIDSYRRFLTLYYHPELADVVRFQPVLRDRKPRWGIEYQGFVLLVAGTFIWAFGDIVNVFWPKTPSFGF